MFDFLRKSSVRSPSAALSQALEADGLPPGTEASALGVVESRGPYAGRKVSHFRVFDRKVAAARAVDLTSRHAYRDIEAHPDLILRAGFTEQDGRIVVHARAREIAREPAAPSGA